VSETASYVLSIEEERLSPAGESLSSSIESFKIVILKLSITDLSL
jgi:hypothetical protein